MTEMEAFLERCGRAGIVMGLGQMRRLLEQLQNPQETMEFVQVAGTNGKGSVTAYVASALAEAGYRTGSFASPAVFSPEETVQADGRPISRREMAAMYRLVEEAARRMEQEDGSWPTAFEAETAMALCWFREKGCSVAVLETGLGGDLDATNVVERTAVSVLTKISVDHSRILGNTVAEIAGHKAGILKAGAEAVSCGQDREAEEVLRQRCARLGIPLTVVEKNHFSEEEICPEDFFQRFRYRSAGGEEYLLKLRLAGDFQRENAAAAVEACEALSRRGYRIEKEAILRGLASVRWPGRLELVGRSPAVVLDGAHNPGAAKELSAALREYLPGRPLYYVMGIFADKDYREVIRRTVPLAENVVAVTAPGKRGLDREILRKTVEEETGKRAETAGSVREAVAVQARRAGNAGAVVVFGSFSILKEAREAALELTGKEKEGRDEGL